MAPAPPLCAPLRSARAASNLRRVRTLCASPSCDLAASACEQLDHSTYVAHCGFTCCGSCDLRRDSCSNAGRIRSTCPHGRDAGRGVPHASSGRIWRGNGVGFFERSRVRKPTDRQTTSRRISAGRAFPDQRSAHAVPRQRTAAARPVCRRVGALATIRLDCCWILGRRVSTSTSTPARWESTRRATSAILTLRRGRLVSRVACFAETANAVTESAA